MPASRIATVLALLLSLPLGGCDAIEDFLFERAADNAIRPDRTEWLDDGHLHVILCGTGTPMPDPDRAGPCTAVIAAGKLFLVDTGPGSWENIQLWRLPRAHLGGVFLTHFHSDHIGELGETSTQSWIAGRTEPLPVYGPHGVGKIVAGFYNAYQQDIAYRTAHHTNEFMPADAAFMEARTFVIGDEEASVVVVNENGLKVTAFRVEHQPVRPAVGYRFDFAGRSVVISGDTKKSANLIRHAEGADLLVHEALAGHITDRVSEILAERGQARLARLAADIRDYHATPVEAAESAKEAGVDMLVLTHMVPPPANWVIQRLFMQGVSEAWDGDIVVGEDGMHFTLPGNAAGIETENL